MTSSILKTAAVASLPVISTILPLLKPAEKTIGFVASEDDEDFDGVMVLKDYIGLRTNGAITVEVFRHPILRQLRRSVPQRAVHRRALYVCK